MSNTNSERRSLALPTTLSEVAAARGVKPREPNKLTDRVETYFSPRYNAQTPEGASFRALFEAAFNVDAVEGKISIDRTEAARLIREDAIAANDTMVGGVQLSKLTAAVNIVARRFGLSVGQNVDAYHRHHGDASAEAAE